MKTLQRIFLLLAAAALVSLITWAVVTVTTVASMPTDTMDFNPQMPVIRIDTGLSFLGIFKSLVPITLIIAAEQAIETWLGKKRKKKNNIVSV